MHGAQAQSELSRRTKVVAPVLVVELMAGLATETGRRECCFQLLAKDP
jgi:hypothetical protein